MTSRTSLVYAAVVAGALLSAALQPGRAEAPAHNDALLALASWAGDAAPDTASSIPAAAASPGASAPAHALTHETPP